MDERVYHELTGRVGNLESRMTTVEKVVKKIPGMVVHDTEQRIRLESVADDVSTIKRGVYTVVIGVLMLIIGAVFAVIFKVPT